MTKESLIDEIKVLHQEIDSNILKLCKARLNKDIEAEKGALFDMEGLMVSVQQDLTCVIDYLYDGKH